MRRNGRYWVTGIVLIAIAAVPTLAGEEDISETVRAVTFSGATATVEYEANIKPPGEVAIEVPSTVTLQTLAETAIINPKPLHIRSAPIAAAEATGKVKYILGFDSAVKTARITLLDQLTTAAPSYLVEGAVAETTAVPLTRIYPRLTIRNGTALAWTNVAINWAVADLLLTARQVNVRPGEATVVQFEGVPVLTRKDQQFQLWVEESEFSREQDSPREVASPTFRMPFANAWPRNLTTPGSIEFVHSGQPVGVVQLAPGKPEERLAQFNKILATSLYRIATAKSERYAVYREQTARLISIRNRNAATSVECEITTEQVAKYTSKSETDEKLQPRVLVAQQPDHVLEVIGSTEVTGLRTEQTIQMTISAGDGYADVLRKRIKKMQLLKDTLRFPMDSGSSSTALFQRGLKRLEDLLPPLTEIETNEYRAATYLWSSAACGDKDRSLKGRQNVHQINQLRRDLIDLFNEKAIRDAPLPADLPANVSDVLEGIVYP